MPPCLKHDDEGFVYACPSCDGAGVLYERSGRQNTHVGDPDDRYVCTKCSETCQEPVERPDGRLSGNGGGPSDDREAKYLADRLSAMNPEDVGLSPMSDPKAAN